MSRKMLEEDRLRAGWSVRHVAWRRGVSIREYRDRGRQRWPNWETFHRICELFGRPQTFAGNVGQSTAGD